MKTVLAEIKVLEQKIAETFESYKKNHPKTKKTRNDPMFQTEKTYKHPMRDSWTKADGMSSEDHNKASNYHSALSDKYEKEFENLSNKGLKGDWFRGQEFSEKRDYHANQANYHDFAAKGDKQMADAYREELKRYRNPYTLR